jgi:stage II sporulation protein AB (anti-sigma F factor)
MKVVFPSLSENERFARIAVSGFLSFIDPKVDELADIKTAVSEAVTNCIVHGYPDEVGQIELTVKVFEDNIVRIKISDKGCGIEDIDQAMQPLFTTKPEEDRAGLGFAVMESFMDKIKVKSKPGKGTAVTLEKSVAVRTRV